ncbi:cbb3-type cytochrome oxidase subunit 3 [Bordetella petrii]|uniref:cbb3-type cytochrome oxidase subunit 3 n=1 Tax=Bordetella petrii TaxID=94624 RepID=UPI001A97368B|nr:CcoQ/FixQ family Cbb3-type cytochrome c oxidase assembly chaperone [Bordetella petrii]MBO1113554.1 CcoQ/FixQ family Cbb3-type cytochrome c oxidase assembly chaperone [Bordetella petrii]
MLIFTGIMTAISLATFLGIVWWAYSRGRQPANHESALLPFALPDENAPAQGATRP